MSERCLEGDHTMEHRWGQRHPFDQMVLLRAAGWRVPARVKDISISGACLRCAIPDPSVVRVRVDFRRHPRATELVAYVVRRTADGVGVEWGEFGSRAVSRLLAEVSPDPVESFATSRGCSGVSPISGRGRGRSRHGI
jgi:hypothetical protein